MGTVKRRPPSSGPLLLLFIAIALFSIISDYLLSENTSDFSMAV